MPAPEEQLLVLTPEKLAALGVVGAMCLSAAKKLLDLAVERLFKRGEKEEAARATKEKELKDSIDGLTKEVRDAFAELRGLITRQDLAIVELRSDLRHAQERVSRLETRLDKEAA